MKGVEDRVDAFASRSVWGSSLNFEDSCSEDSLEVGHFNAWAEHPPPSIWREKQSGRGKEETEEEEEQMAEGEGGGDAKEDNAYDTTKKRRKGKKVKTKATKKMRRKKRGGKKTRERTT